MSNEWYTPSKYIEAARQVMGSIDLDPASCELANQTVKATRYYTQEENGLSKPWYGNVWLNPPYGRNTTVNGVWKGGGKSLVALWIDRLIEVYQSDWIDQAIMLVQADTDAAWFQPLWEYIICFPHKQIYFHVPRGENNKQIFGSIFVYLGANEQRFIDVFSQFGRIAKAVDVPVAKPRQLELVEGIA